VLAVDDPHLTSLADSRMGEGWLRADTEGNLRAFVAAAAAGVEPSGIVYEVVTGKPAIKILSVARTTGTGLIVMGAHGRSGVGTQSFGAITERVLRETTAPVLLVTADPGPISFDDLARLCNPMLVPVDFSSASSQQVRIAGAIARALRPRVLIGHVIEPIDLPVPEQIDNGEITSERHRRACQGLQLIAVGGSMPVAPGILVTSGDPADEIARWSYANRVGLLVMALHADGDSGPRMGSVTHRAITLSHVLTLALPPSPGVQQSCAYPRAQDLALEVRSSQSG
jgi:nucleotide-binding universal stress UspA family protein